MEEQRCRKVVAEADAVLERTYVSGWLAGRTRLESCSTLAATLQSYLRQIGEFARESLSGPEHDGVRLYLLGKSDLAKDDVAAYGRLCAGLSAAPPSAPPVRRPQDEELRQALRELREIQETTVGEDLAAAINSVEHRLLALLPLGEHWPIPPAAPSVNEDRMLLLKALVKGAAVLGFINGRRCLSIGPSVWGAWSSLAFDAEGFPILADDLRAALVKATEAEP